MNPVSLCYHDVIAAGDPDVSGFPGADAATYKLDLDLFRDHLDAIRQAAGKVEVRLTFDDGGSSAQPAIADELERRGFAGFFFITTDYIGQPGFLSAKEIAALHARGHAIGSHGCSHRGRMSSLPFDKLMEEWARSCGILSGIIGAPVTCGSVPSGFYAPRVATAASEAGIRELYTQEPTSRCETIAGCMVRGRFTIRAWTDSRTVTALVRRDPFACIKARAWWEVKELSKGVGGRAYTKVRRSFYRLTSVAASKHG